MLYNINHRANSIRKYSMLISVKQQGKFNAVDTDSIRATEMLARAIGNYLDGNQFNIADEVNQPSKQYFKTYQGLTGAEFLEARHVTRITRDPLYRFDPVVNHSPKDYILFDLDQDKIIIPDFNDYDPDFMLYETAELNSYYEAYKHAAGIITLNKPMLLALEKNWIMVQPQVEHHQEDNVLLRSTFHFREYKAKSEIIKVDYCYCCGTFECKCTEEELSTFRDELPF